ncbi:MAG: type II toxin-antitoxin system Phd/YefM family antitoxin [Deltaproteobacteria bacterium]|nr:type II toxin-antitoxin system Phd/YefM family antitoxin [Deltaproteobacteria bacterium]MBI3295727.1 type II toxin-antitoxin system Phd/YefM family antitoxin [Deltaproteobacteria bacterium]
MKVNALQVRQSFGKILKKLIASDEPIIIEKGRLPVAVLISLKTFQERFIDYREQQKKEAVLERFKKAAVESKTDSLKALRELRYGSDR